MQKEQALLCSQTEKDKVRMQKKEAGLLKKWHCDPRWTIQSRTQLQPKTRKDLLSKNMLLYRGSVTSAEIDRKT